MTLRKWLERDDFSLALSAGFFSFYAHAGFVKALSDFGLKPRRLMGSSAGALLSSLVCAGYDLKEIELILAEVKRSDFWDFKPGPGILAGQKFRRLLEKYLPKTFEELDRPLTVAAHPVFGFKPEYFSSGDLVSAVHASCCFPGMFHPVKIDGVFFIDGGVTDWAGALHVPRQERLLIHHIRPSGPHGAWVERQMRRLMKANRKLVTLPGLMPMGPHRMHDGPKAIAESYSKTLQILKTSSR